MRAPVRASATAHAAAWAALLALLGWAWVHAPVLGTGRALLLWTAPAVALAGLTWRGLGRWGSPRPGAGWVAGLALLWALLLASSVSGVGPEWAMDGLILRQDARKLAGDALTWAPFAVALLSGLLMLGLSLEARYRASHPRRSGGSGDRASA